jgi:hypothetical protein
MEHKKRVQKHYIKQHPTAAVKVQPPAIAWQGQPISNKVKVLIEEKVYEIEGGNDLEGSSRSIQCASKLCQSHHTCCTGMRDLSAGSCPPWHFSGSSTNQSEERA